MNENRTNYNGYGENENINSAAQNNNGSIGSPSGNNAANNQGASGWVFSDRQNQQGGSYSGQETTSYSSSGNGYNSKYSYTSYQQQKSQGTPYHQEHANQTGNTSGTPWQQVPVEAKQESYKWKYEDYQAHQQPRGPQKPKKNRGLKVFAGILGAIVCICLVCLAGYGVYSLIDPASAATQDNSNSTAANPSQQETFPNEHSLTLNDRPEEDQAILADGKLTIPQQAEKVKPSVVGVVNYQQSNSSMYATAQLQGSGIIMSEDGYIITNAHVVQNALGLKVVLNDGTEYAAQIIGTDTKTDLAVIKIEATGLQAAEFGNSDQVQVGEQVIAVGNPTGLQLGGTVTVGYVSALNRIVDSTRGSLECIQTDAAINPGNTGGALANEYGQIIGINSSKIAGEDIEGLGFAISINEAQPIIDDLINYGYVKGRVKIGITVQDMDRFMAAYSNAPQGVLVMGIDNNTPAATSGLVPGDIITSIDGQTITGTDDLSAILETKSPGDTIVLGIFRRTTGNADREIEISLQLIESVEKPDQVTNYFTNN